MPHSAFANEETPFYRWFETTPNGKYLQIFGSDVRVNIPQDNNPRPRKYVDSPGYIAKYIGFDYSSREHICWDYNKFQTRQNPVVYVGNDQCKFFRLLNSKFFVVPHSDPAYTEFLPYANKAETAAQSELPVKTGIRIAKSFRNKF